MAQKWADQCADVDYKEDYKRKDPSLFHDPHPQRKIGKNLIKLKESAKQSLDSIQFI